MVSLHGISRYATEVGHYLLSETPKSTDNEIYEEIMFKASHLAEYSQNDYQKISNIQKEIDNLQIAITTKKRYQSQRHFYPSIYLSKSSFTNPSDKTAQDEPEESIESDDDSGGEEGGRKDERCVRCDQETYGDIRFLRCS